MEIVFTANFTFYQNIIFLKYRNDDLFLLQNPNKN